MLLQCDQCEQQNISSKEACATQNDMMSNTCGPHGMIPCLEHVVRRGRRPTEEPSDLWVSAALVKLRFSHESPYFVNGVHRVAAGSSRQCFAIDVLGPESLATPSQRELGSTMVRVRQMTALGWQREAVRSLDVVQEERAGQLVRFLSPLLPGTSQP